jgi:FkbM family methyltransferase
VTGEHATGTPAPTPRGRRSLLAGVRDRLAEAKRYAGLIDWGWTLYDRAILRWPGLPWPGRGRVVGVRPAGLGRPVYVRLGASDLHVVSEIFLHGEYDAVIEALKARGREVRTIVDLGANIGVSVQRWRQVFPGATVVAVEPDAANMAMVERNASGPVKLVRACVAGVARTVTLDRSEAAWGFRMADGTGRANGGATTEEIRAVTLPQLLAESGISGGADLLKCDIEGAEEELFAHAREWIDRFDLMIVEVHRDYTVDRLLADIRRADARAWSHRVLNSGSTFSVVLLSVS